MPNAPHGSPQKSSPPDAAGTAAISAGSPYAPVTGNSSPFHSATLAGEPLSGEHEPVTLTELSGNDAEPNAARGEGSGAAGKIAAIDIGSNSIHLLMAELDAAFGFRVLGRDKEMARIGRGGYGDHVLTPEAVEAASTVLSRFVKLARARGIDTFRAVATSAVREATNGGDFIEHIRRLLGLRIKVITGVEEGRLVYLAVRDAVDIGDRTAMILDLGGGSLQIVIGNRERPLKIESHKLGSGRMAELFLRRDPPSEADLIALRHHLDGVLAPAVARLGRQGAEFCIGTSGTMGALSELCSAAEREAGHHHALSESHSAEPSATAGSHNSESLAGRPGFTREQLAELYRKLSRRDAEGRARLPGADPRRTDQIAAGAAVALAVMEHFDIPRIAYCDQSLRDGIVANYLDRHQRGLWARRTYPDPRERTVMFLAERCDWQQEHAEQVARLATGMFDGWRGLHQLPERYRELLRYAALLHDIGYLIGQDQHHRHSEYLIRHGGLQGFTPEEVEIIALTARFHRGADPEGKSGPLGELAKPARRAVKRLAAILRLAEGLDRSHFSAVTSVATWAEPAFPGQSGRAILRVCGGDLELEIWAAQRRRHLFESVFELPLVIEHGAGADGRSALSK